MVGAPRPPCERPRAPRASRRPTRRKRAMPRRPPTLAYRPRSSTRTWQSASSWVRSERHATRTHRRPTSGASERSSSGRPVRALRARASKARRPLALANFDGVVLGALRDAETALNTYVHDLQREDSTRSARDEAERAVRDSERLQAAGRATAVTVIDSQRAYAASEQTLPQLETANR